MKKLRQSEVDKVMIALRTRGNDICLGLLRWYINMTLRYKRLHLFFFHDNQSAPSNDGRVHKAMLKHKEYERVLFIDSDVVPPPWTLEKLWRDNKDVVGIPVWMAEATTSNVHIAYHPENEYTRHNHLIKERKGLVRVVLTCFGGFMVNRRVFERVQDEPLFMGYDKQGVSVVRGNDVYFARQMKKYGFEMWVDFDLAEAEHWTRIKLCDKVIEDIRDVRTIDTRDNSTLYTPRHPAEHTVKLEGGNVA